MWSNSHYYNPSYNRIVSNLESIKSPGYFDANNVDYDIPRPKDKEVNALRLLSQNKFLIVDGLLDLWNAFKFRICVVMAWKFYCSICGVIESTLVISSKVQSWSGFASSV